MKCFGVIIQIKPLQQYFLMVLSIEYVVLTFESEVVILWSDHSNETSSAVLSHGTIYLEFNTNFLVGAWNPRMWPFKWNFLSSTFTWFHLFFSMLLNNFRKFSWLFTWATFGSERVRNLFYCFDWQNRQSEALPLYERALQIYEEMLGTSHPRVAETLVNLAKLLYDLVSILSL